MNTTGTPLSFEASISDNDLQKTINDIESGIKGIENVAKSAENSFNALSTQVQSLHVQMATIKTDIDGVAASERLLKKSLRENIITENEYIQKTAELGAKRQDLTAKLKEYRLELSKVVQEQDRAARVSVKPYTSADTQREVIAQSNRVNSVDTGEQLTPRSALMQTAIEDIKKYELELTSLTNKLKAGSLDNKTYETSVNGINTKIKDVRDNMAYWDEALSNSMRNVTTAEKKKNVLDAVGDAYKEMLEDAIQVYGELDSLSSQHYQDLNKLETESKNLTAAQKELSDAFKNGDITQRQYLNASRALSIQQGENKNRISVLNQEIQRNNAVEREAIGSISQKTARLTQLQVQYNKLSEAQRNNINVGGRMRTEFQQLKIEVDKLNNSLSGSSSPVKGIGRVMGGLRGVAGAVGITFGAGMLWNFGKDLFKIAKEAEGVENAFYRLGNTNALNNLRTATKGTVSDLELMKLAVRADNFKIPMDVLSNGMEFARRQAVALGRDVDYMTNSFVDGIGRKSTLVLDNLGISASELQAEIKKVGDFTIAVGNIMSEKSAQMGTDIDTLADKTSKWVAEWDNLKLSISKVWNGIFNAGAPDNSVIQKGIEGAKKDIEGFDKWNLSRQKGTIEANKKSIEGVKKQLSVLNKQSPEFSDIYQATRKERSVSPTELLNELRKPLLEKEAILISINNELTKSYDINEKADRVSKGQVSNLELSEQIAEKRKLANEWVVKDESDQKNVNKLLKDAADIQDKLDKRNGEGAKKETKSTESKAKELAREVKEREKILKNWADVDAGFQMNAMLKDEAEVQSVKDKYSDIKKLIEEFNNKTKGEKISFEGFDTSMENSITQVTYKQDTASLKDELDKQRQIFQEYEEFKKSTSEEMANERFESEKVAFDDYASYIQSEIDKLNKATTGRAKTGGEKGRENMLLDEQKSVNASKRKIENAYLIEVYNATLSNEQKIAAIKEKYIKEEKTLREKHAGKDLEDRLKVSADNASNEFNQYFQNLLNEEKKFEDLGTMVAGATKNQIRAQIQSLQNYLTTAADLTQEQRDRLQAMILSLGSALPTATNDGTASSVLSQGNTRLTDLSNEAIAAKNKIAELQKGIEVINQSKDIVPEQAITKVQELQAEINGLTARLKDINSNAELFGALSETFEDIGNGVKELANDLGGLNEGLTNTLNIIGDIANIGANGLGGVANLLKGVEGIKNLDKGNGLLSGIKGLFSKDAENGGGLLGGLSSIVGIAGPIGKGVAMIGKAIGGVVNHFKAIKESEIAAKKAMNDFYNEAKRGELEYQALLRQREMDDVKRGKTSYQGLVAQLDLLKNQSPEIKKAYDEVFAALQNSEFVSDKGYQHSTWIRKAKTWDIMSSLSGKEYEDLEKLDLEGRLTGDTKEKFQTLKKFRDELKEAGLDIEDIQQQLDEMFTGTSVEGLSDALADLFASGKASAENFGKSLEEILRNAIINGFKYRYLEEAMEPLFDYMKEAGKDGWTKQEVDEAIRMGNAIFEGAKAMFEPIDDLFNEMGWSTPDDSSSPTRDTINRITETQADAITGTLKGLQIGIIEGNSISRLQTEAMVKGMQLQLSASYKAIEYLIAIKDNTGKTAENTVELQRMGSLEKSLKSIDSKMSNADNVRRAAGL